MIFIDTGKTTEEWMGNWLEKKITSGFNRKDIYISTKVNPAGIGGSTGKPHAFELKTTLQSCKDSIARLKCGYIDLYHLHWPTRNVSLWGSGSQTNINSSQKNKTSGDRDEFIAQVKTIKALLDEGLIKYWALSNENAYGVTMFCMICDELGVPRPIALQNDFSVLNRTYECDTLEACYRFGIVGLPYGVLAGGTLSGKYFDSSKYAKMDEGVRKLSECRHRKKTVSCNFAKVLY